MYIVYSTNNNTATPWLPDIFTRRCGGLAPLYGVVPLALTRLDHAQESVELSLEVPGRAVSAPSAQHRLSGVNGHPLILGGHGERKQNAPLERLDGLATKGNVVLERGKAQGFTYEHGPAISHAGRVLRPHAGDGGVGGGVRNGHGVLLKVGGWLVMSLAYYTIN